MNAQTAAKTIMLVDERRATVGVLRLIGLPTDRILTQLFIEALVLSACSGIAGGRTASRAGRSRARS